MVGIAFSLYLTINFPLLLNALAPLDRHLILVAPAVNPFALLAIVVTRRFVLDLLFYFIGRAAGPTAIAWIEQRYSRTGRFIRWLERFFERSSRFALVLLPGPIMSTLAGSSGMRIALYVPLVLLGLVLRTTVLLSAAAWLRGPIETLRGWIDTYWLPGTVVLVIGVAIYGWRQRHSLRRGLDKTLRPPQPR